MTALRRLVILPLLLATPAVVAAQDQPAAPAPTAPAQPKRPTGTEAVIGILNKRLATTEELRVRPGQQFRSGTLRGIMHACERTAPWEPRQEEGAFVQIIEQPLPKTRTEAPPKPRTLFSGWLFARSPSLNPLRHPVYDVWLKSCTMDFPDGPNGSSGTASRTSGGSTPGNGGRGAPKGGG